jgi:Protein of unknown function (DUF2950).
MKLYGIMFLILAFCIAAGCDRLKSDSPSATFKAFAEAAQKKDVEAMKKALSRGTLKMMETEAKMENVALDEMLKREDFARAYDETPETRSERVAGDTATLEVKNKISGEWETIPFVREDGEWKLALDKYLEDVLKKLAAGPEKPASAENDTNSSTQTTNQ